MKVLGSNFIYSVPGYGYPPNPQDFILATHGASNPIEIDSTSSFYQSPLSFKQLFTIQIWLNIVIIIDNDWDNNNE